MKDVFLKNKILRKIGRFRNVHLLNDSQIKRFEIIRNTSQF